ncbi:hypothetical protein [Algihabitans albus]|uniref:hypothetical protein n=1 Tax=Algihabitans albus TaxID=2164067 RepID=UPI000E5D5365|nr:hypothetical protein [Algihabitans albus]
MQSRANTRPGRETRLSDTSDTDYATNLVTGDYRNTGLGRSFRAARGTPQTGFQAFVDPVRPTSSGKTI